MKITHQILKQRQGLPLEAKIIFSQKRIREWHDHWLGQTYIAFSGGKDSTVLLDLVRELYPETPAVFCDTGLEYPEIKDFVKTIPNVIWVKPKLTFKQVLDKYGYPIISKNIARMLHELQTRPKDSLTYILRKTGINSKGEFHTTSKLPQKYEYLENASFKISDECCAILKKNPSKEYEKISKRHPYTGVMAADSRMREAEYLKHGCNAFNNKRPISTPLGIWLEQDIWDYIKLKQIPYSKIYDMGHLRTGCMFGVHLESSPNRFEKMKEQHPKIYDYCINKLELNKILDILKIKY